MRFHLILAAALLVVAGCSNPTLPDPEPTSGGTDTTDDGAGTSGFGREGPRYAVHEMTEERIVTFTLA